MVLMQAAVWQLGLVLQELYDWLEVVISSLSLADIIQGDGCKLDVASSACIHAAMLSLGGV